MTITCPHCQRTIRGPEKLAGQLIKCPACGGQMECPSLAEIIAAEAGVESPVVSTPHPQSQPQALTEEDVFPSQEDGGDEKQVAAVMTAPPRSSRRRKGGGRSSRTPRRSREGASNGREDEESSEFRRTPRRSRRKLVILVILSVLLLGMLLFFGLAVSGFGPASSGLEKLKSLFGLGEKPTLPASTPAQSDKAKSTPEVESTSPLSQPEGKASPPATPTSSPGNTEKPVRRLLEPEADPSGQSAPRKLSPPDSTDNGGRRRLAPAED